MSAGRHHKGIVCPNCKARSFEVDPGSFGFDYLSDVTVARRILGFTEDGRLHVNGLYEDFSDDRAERLACQRCCHEFPLVDDVRQAIEWD